MDRPLWLVNVKTRKNQVVYATSTFPIVHLIFPLKFCISIVFNFSWEGCNLSQSESGKYFEWIISKNILQVLPQIKITISYISYRVYLIFYLSGAQLGDQGGLRFSDPSVYRSIVILTWSPTSAVQLHCPVILLPAPLSIFSDFCFFLCVLFAITFTGPVTFSPLQ